MQQEIMWLVAAAAHQVIAECASMSSVDEEAIKKREADKTAYTKLWNEFGKALKMGVVEDTANRNRLAKLLRVRSLPECCLYHVPRDPCSIRGFVSVVIFCN
jgi:HSP90 family molecular chaperone